MTRLLACHGFRLSQRLCQSHCQLCKTELTALILDNCKVECCRAIGVAMSEPLSCLRRFPASVSPGLDVVQQESCVFLAPMCLLLSTATGLTNTYPSNLYSNPKSSQHKEQRYPAPSSSSAADGRSPICCAVASMSLSGALLSSAGSASSLLAAMVPLLARALSARAMRRSSTPLLLGGASCSYT